MILKEVICKWISFHSKCHNQFLKHVKRCYSCLIYAHLISSFFSLFFFALQKHNFPINYTIRVHHNEVFRLSNISRMVKVMTLSLNLLTPLLFLSEDMVKVIPQMTLAKYCNACDSMPPVKSLTPEPS